MPDLKLNILMAAADRISAPFKAARKSTEALRQDLSGTAQKLKTLEDASKKLSAYKKLRADTKATAAALTEARDKATRMGQALAESGEKSKTAERSFQAARRTVRRLQETFENQTASADRLRQGLTADGIVAERFRGTTRDLATGEGGLAAAERTLKRDLDATRRAMERQTGAAKRMREARETMKRTMGLSAKVAVVGGATAGVAFGAKTAIGNVMEPMAELEAARGDIASLGMNRAEQAAVIATARKTSTQISGVTADGFVRAAYDIKSGIASLSADGVASMTQAAAVTAKATKSNVATMTSLFASGYGTFKRQFAGMSDQSFGGMFASSIAKAVQQFKTTGDKMQQAIQSAGAGATNLGMSMADQFTALGMLQQTMEAGEAGTSLRSFAANAAKAQTAFDKLHNGVQLLTKDGKLRSLPDILKSLKAAYGDTLDAREAQQIQQAFGTEEAMKIVSNLWGMDEGFRKNSAAMADAGKSGLDYASAMAQAAQGNYADRLQLLHQRLDEVKLSIGEALLPTLEKLMARVGPIVDKAAQWIDRNKSLAATLGVAAIAVAGIAAVLSPLMLFASTLIGSFAVMRFALTALGIKAGFAGTAFKALGRGVLFVGRAMLTNPIGIAITAIALAAFLLIRYWKPIKAFFVGLWQGVVRVFSAAWKRPKSFFAWTPLGQVVAHWKPIKDFFVGLWNGIAGAFKAAWAVITKGLSIIKGPLDWVSRQVHAVFGGDKAPAAAQPPHRAIKIAKTAAAVAVAAPLAVAAPAHHPAVSQHIAMGGVTIHVHAAPGQTEADVAKAVRRELEKMQAEKARAARSRLYDKED